MESVDSKECKFHILVNKPTCPYGSYSGYSQRSAPTGLLYNIVVYSFHSMISDGGSKTGSVGQEKEISLGKWQGDRS